MSSQEYRVCNIHKSISVMGHVSRLKDRHSLLVEVQRSAGNQSEGLIAKNKMNI